MAAVLFKVFTAKCPSFEQPSLTLNAKKEDVCLAYRPRYKDFLSVGHDDQWHPMSIGHDQSQF